MITGVEYCKSKGLDFSSYKDSSIPIEDFKKHGIEPIVECCACGMTMAFGSCHIDPDKHNPGDGLIYCSDCAEIMLEAINFRYSPEQVVEFLNSIKDFKIDYDKLLVLHHGANQYKRRNQFVEGGFIDNLLQLIEDHLTGK